MLLYKLVATILHIEALEAITTVGHSLGSKSSGRHVAAV